MSIINNIKAILIGKAILDIMLEDEEIRMNPFPKLNPYYYKIRRLNETEEVQER